MPWTNDLKTTIADYVNPNNNYHTDGQIVGAPTRQWYASFGDLQTPLHKAASGGRYLAVQLLLEALHELASYEVRSIERLARIKGGSLFTTTTVQ